ncbi:MAG: isoprenylcysteine carboxylmethyltransferase family protein [Rickettsiales bacterium]|nr:isoprenylcysteine carboxylmethyltransferase family protein [Rickettsiales bacterium]
MSTANPKLLKARQRHTRWFSLVLVLAVLFSHTAFRHGSVEDIILEWAGYMLVIVCVLGRSYCSAYIGGIKNEGVMQLGPYSIVRNPLYVFSFIGVFGVGLQSDSISVLSILIGMFILYYKVVVDKEEAFLTSKFGDSYLAYKARVPRWFPKFSLWNEPEEMLTRPFFIRHTMMDASLFFLAMPIFQLLEALHESGYIDFFYLP